MEDNKKKIFLMAVAIVTLLTIVIGATYAYFAVTEQNNFGTRTVSARAGGMASVVLNGSNTTLLLNLSASDMMQNSNDIVYYASSS